MIVEHVFAAVCPSRSSGNNGRLSSVYVILKSHRTSQVTQRDTGAFGRSEIQVVSIK